MTRLEDVSRVRDEGAKLRLEDQRQELCFERQCLDWDSDSKNMHVEVE